MKYTQNSCSRYFLALVFFTISASTYAGELTVNIIDNEFARLDDNLRIRIFDESAYQSVNQITKFGGVLRRNSGSGGNSFSFRDITPGKYLIIAYIDVNDNRQIDAGDKIGISNVENPNPSMLPAFSDAAIELSDDGLTIDLLLE